MLESIETRLAQLFVLNVALQLFDGVATYQGLRLGFYEANPLLITSFQTLGVLPALLLFKAKACGLILLIRRGSPAQVSLPALRMLAVAYCVLSLVPWLSHFAWLAGKIA